MWRNSYLYCTSIGARTLSDSTKPAGEPFTLYIINRDVVVSIELVVIIIAVPINTLLSVNDISRIDCLHRDSIQVRIIITTVLDNVLFPWLKGTSSLYHPSSWSEG